MTINQRKYDLHVLNHNYGKASKSPNALVIVEPMHCDDNVIEVPFEENVNDSNDKTLQIASNVVSENDQLVKLKKKLKIKDKSTDVS